MPMPHDPEIFAAAKADDPALLLARLPGRVSPFELRDEDGISLVQFCLYRGLKRNLAALLALSRPVPLHEAAALGDEGAVSQALERSPDVLNLLSTDGWTALHLAAFFGHGHIIALLLARGANPGIWARAFERNLPLHAACAGRVQKADAVRLLIPVTDIDARQGGGWTALMLASVNGMADSVAALITAGADRTLVNDKGKAAAELAREQGHHLIADRLAERG